MSEWGETEGPVQYGNPASMQVAESVVWSAKLDDQEREGEKWDYTRRIQIKELGGKYTLNLPYLYISSLKMSNTR
ncbi:hypothetical protein F0562_001296 [Nyssa sinensis]|uniref:Uncharacterized protein n=1 Tax=Nyssa sinensis TaxID=561372 RepID=A0A5J5C3Z8_9ASTE|nr:hypothetical protein F0562_001296 [Nyssa sinensis]